MHRKHYITILIGFLFTTTVVCQFELKGTIVDQNSIPLVGATIQAGDNGSISDINGGYTLLLDAGEQSLKVSYLGFRSSQLYLNIVSDSTANFSLQPDLLNLETVLISASFNEKSKLESSVSVSTIDRRETERLAPMSAAEILKQVPGIYINDANGEVGNEISARGLDIQFFSIQEDGLASSISEMASNERFAKDMFLRTDLMTSRIEVIRGGSASITTANSPGGIFNYINHTGGQKFKAELLNRFGVQANGKEIYNKLETRFSGPLLGTEWNYAIGGHYRRDGGNRQTLFPHSDGGQVKANLTRVFKDRASLKLYAKYLDDRVGFNRPTWVSDWSDIKPAPGFNWDDNLILPDVQFDIGDSRNSTNQQVQLKSILTRDQQKIKEETIGAKLDIQLSENWRITSHSRISNKSIEVNHIAEEGGFASVAIDGLFARLFTNFNWVVPNSEVNQTYRNMVLGQMDFFDIQSGEVLASVDNSLLLRGQVPEVLTNNLPQGELFWASVNNDEIDIREIVQQFKLSGTIKNHLLTIGSYFHSARNNRNINSASAYMTIEPIPRLLGTRVQMMDFSSVSQFVPELRPLDPISNQQAVFSNSTGLHGYNSLVNEDNILTENIFSVYANDEWTINEQINAEFGIRYESINHNGRTGISLENDIEANPTGADGNLLTVHDNAYNYLSSNFLPIDITYNTFSFSAGLNYKLSKNAAIYTRYSSSEKLLDAIYEQDMFVGNQPPTFVPREINQLEAGFKYASGQLGVFGLIYRSVEKNIFNQLFVICLSCDGGFYLTDPLYNSVQYWGAEMELNSFMSRWWNISAKLNISGGTNLDYKIVNTGTSELPDDDIIMDLSGQPVAGSTANKFDLSPLDITNTFFLNKNRIQLFINYRRYSERFANSQQSFTLPSFNLFKVGLAVEFNKQITTSFNINNLFNTVGVLRFNGYNAVAGFPENVTTEFIDNNPNMWFKTQRSLPRAFYFTINYKL